MHKRLGNVVSERGLARLEHRELVRAMLDRSEHLLPEDRALLRSVYWAGLSATELANATGRGPQSIRRRLHRIVNRMNSEPFIFVLRHAGRWPSPRREVARAVFLRGQSQRQAAASLKLSFHVVRRETDRIRTLAEEERMIHKSASAPPGGELHS